MPAVAHLPLIPNSAKPTGSTSKASLFDVQVIVLDTGLPEVSRVVEGVTEALNPGICIAADAGAGSSADGITTETECVPIFVTPSAASHP
jgi:hypothetical protein